MQTTCLDPVTPETHTHTIIFLHGRGDNGSQLATSLFDSLDSQGRTLRELFPSFRWVFPHAPLSRPAAFPQDLMRQWFDTWNSQDLREREELKVNGLQASVKAILDIISEETEKLGGNSERLILAGISQGASTAVHVLLQLDHSPPPGSTSSRLGALIGFCGRFPLAGRSLAATREIIDPTCTPTSNQFLRNTPILLEHCVDDPLARVEDGRVLKDAFIVFGAQVRWIEYPDGGHWIQSPQGVDDAASFLRETVASEIRETPQ